MTPTRPATSNSLGSSNSNTSNENDVSTLPSAPVYDLASPFPSTSTTSQNPLLRLMPFFTKSSPEEQEHKRWLKQFKKEARKQEAGEAKMRSAEALYFAAVSKP
ncbi:hypothetical protein BT69DRAFT_1354094 [Atractiella rhizophila]|nr:hypothetical protein BT69DRAFT_1354094 [Atractiella rhizophila]